MDWSQRGCLPYWRSRIHLSHWYSPTPRVWLWWRVWQPSHVSQFWISSHDQCHQCSIFFSFINFFISINIIIIWKLNNIVASYNIHGTHVFHQHKLCHGTKPYIANEINSKIFPTSNEKGVQQPRLYEHELRSQTQSVLSFSWNCPQVVLDHQPCNERVDACFHQDCKQSSGLAPEQRSNDLCIRSTRRNPHRNFLSHSF